MDIKQVVASLEGQAYSRDDLRRRIASINKNCGVRKEVLRLINIKHKGAPVRHRIDGFFKRIISIQIEFFNGYHLERGNYADSALGAMKHIKSILGFLESVSKYEHCAISRQFNKLPHKVSSALEDSFSEIFEAVDSYKPTAGMAERLNRVRPVSRNETGDLIEGDRKIDWRIGLTYILTIAEHCIDRSIRNPSWTDTKRMTDASYIAVRKIYDAWTHYKFRNIGRDHLASLSCIILEPMITGGRSKGSTQFKSAARAVLERRSPALPSREKSGENSLPSAQE